MHEARKRARRGVAVGLILALASVAGAARAQEEGPPEPAREIDDAAPPEASASPPAESAADAPSLEPEAVVAEVPEEPAADPEEAGPAGPPRLFGTALVTSDPEGARVTVGGDQSCTTPCRLMLPPGEHQFAFSHRGHEELEVTARMAAGAQVRVHGVLGKAAAWQLIVPLYFVGSIFTAGGVSALVANQDAGPQEVGTTSEPADARRFNRNLGIASLVVGVPVLGLATYLLATGRPAEATVSETAGEPSLSVGPAIDATGQLAGASLNGTF